MRLTLLALSLAILFPGTAIARQPDISGSWDLRMDWPEGSGTGNCQLEHKGETLTGSCGGDQRFAVKGRVEGRRVSWEVQVEGGAFRLAFTGTLEEDDATIRGTCEVVGFNKGEFTLTRTTNGR